MLKMRHESSGNSRVYHLEGAVTTLEAGTLKQEVRDAIREGTRAIYLDFSASEFVDSAGLGAVVALHKSAVEVDGTLTLCALQPNVLAVFELTRLHRVLTIVDEVPSLEVSGTP